MSERQFGKVTWSDQNGSQVAVVKIFGQEEPLQFGINKRTDAKIYVRCHRCVTLNVRRKSAGLKKLSVCHMPISAVENQWLINPLDPKCHICKLKPLPALTKRMTAPEIAQRNICKLSSTNSHTEPCAPKTQTSAQKKLNCSQDFGRVKWIPGIRKHRLACVDVPNQSKRLFFTINNISATTTRVQCCRCRAAVRKNRLKRCTRGSIVHEKKFLIKNDRWVGRNPADERWHCCEFRLLSNSNSDVIESKPDTPKKEIPDTPARSSSKKAIIREINSDNFPTTSTAAIKADSVQDSYTKSSTYGKVCWYSDKIAIVRHPESDQLIRFNRKLPSSASISRFLLKCDWCTKLNSERARKGLLTFSQLCFIADSDQWYLDPLDATLHCCGLKPPTCQYKSVKLGHKDDIEKSNNAAPLQAPPSVEVSPINAKKAAAYWGSVKWTYGKRGNNLAYELMPGQPPITFYIYQRKGQILRVRCTRCREFYHANRGKMKATFRSFLVKNNQWIRNPLDPKYHCCRIALESPKSSTVNKNELESVVCTIENSGMKNWNSPLEIISERDGHTTNPNFDPTRINEDDKCTGVKHNGKLTGLNTDVQAPADVGKINWTVSRTGSKITVYQSRIHPNVVYRFSRRVVDEGRDRCYVRCLNCLRTNSKRRSMGMATLKESTCAIRDGQFWIDDPDRPNNPHICVELNPTDHGSAIPKTSKDVTESFHQNYFHKQTGESGALGKVKWVQSNIGTRIIVYRSRLHSGIIYRFSVDKGTLGRNPWYVRCLECMRENRKRKQRGEEYYRTSGFAIDANEYWIDDPDKPERPHVCTLTKIGKNNSDKHKKNINENSTQSQNALGKIRSPPSTNFGNVEWATSLKGNQVAVYRSRTHPGNVYRFTKNGCKKGSYGGMDVRCVFCESENNRRRKSGLVPVPVSRVFISADGKWTEDPENPKNPHICVNSHTEISNKSGSRKSISKSPAEIPSKISPASVFPRSEPSSSKVLSTSILEKMECDATGNSRKDKNEVIDPSHLQPGLVCRSKAKRRKLNIEDGNLADSKQTYGRVRWLKCRTLTTRRRVAIAIDNAQNGSQLSYHYIIVGKGVCGGERLCCQFCLSANQKRRLQCAKPDEDQQIPFIWIRNGEWQDDPVHPKIPHICDGSARKRYPRGQTSGRRMNHGIGARRHRRRSQQANLSSSASPDDRLSLILKRLRLQKRMRLSAVVIRKTNIGRRNASDRFISLHSKAKQNLNNENVPRTPFLAPYPDEQGDMGNTSTNSDSPSTSQYVIKTFVNNENSPVSTPSLNPLRNNSNRSPFRKSDASTHKFTPPNLVLRERQNIGIPSISLHSTEVDSGHDRKTSDGIAKVDRNDTKCFEDQLRKANGVLSDAFVCIPENDVVQIDSLPGQSGGGTSSARNASSYVSCSSSVDGPKMMPIETFEDLNEDEDDEILNKNGIYTVERILALRYTSSSKNPEYLLKWKDWRYETCTWEKQKDLSCEQLIVEFLVRHKLRLLIANKLNMPELPTFFMMQSFYSCQRWEDELNHIARENGQAPIYVENWVDNAIRPKAFTFITKNLISPEAQQAFQTPKKDVDGCQCTGANPCGYGDMCCPEVFSYTSQGRLRRYFDKKKDWIVECSDQCSCDITCPTRLVQRGRQIPIVLFRTLDRGWSVRAAAKIRSNSFVMEYVGEVITIEQAEQKSPTYQFQMDGCGASKCAFVVDAANCGNEARFVNHSCDPNMVVHSVYADRLDMRYLRLTYFACRDIEKGEEITINYNANVDNAAYAKRTKNRSVKSCFCKSEKCRGFII
ncbi:SET domain-containing protein [Ditylenchus destructor]|uniref:SET domain-containing protein n=1 Tax=Ditylenchus destructor TaxID=166010 RepID=A0AAD4RD02_9BILA|nr:SET domain-containing protein [Ditylenchus destructor]